MNKPVSFDLAKLLKEKGFDENCRYGYNGSFEPHHTGLIEFGYLQTNSELLELTYLAPTIADVVMWLYEKHGIWIRVTPIPYSDNLTHWRWEHMSTNYSTRSLKWKKEQDYMSPTEAYEAAIEYCLTKLI